MRFLCFFVAILILLQSAATKAQEFYFSSPQDPLVARQASIYDIAQDKDGLVWLASDTDGLIRFDGYRSANWFKHDHRELGRQNINSMLFATEHDLWLGSWGQGLSKIELSSGKILRFLAEDPSNSSLASNRIHTLFQDSQQRIWIGTMQGVNFIEASVPDQLQRFANTSDHPLYHERIWSITEFNQSLWFATSNHLYQVSLDLQQTKQYQMPAVNGISETRLAEVRFVGQFSQQLYTASTAGVFVYQQNCDCFTSIIFPENLPSPRVNTLISAADSRLWVGAIDGLYLLDTQQHQWLQGEAGYNFLPDIDIRSLKMIDNDQLWVGSRDQGLLIGRSRYQGFKPLVLDMPETMQTDGQRLVSTVLYDSSGRLWLATNNKIQYRDQFGTWFNLDARRNQGIQRIYKIAEDPAGDIWFATDRGLYRYDGSQLIIEQRPFDLVNLMSGNVTSLFITDDGQFYLNLWQQGVLHWQPSSDQASIQLAEHFSRHGNQIYQISQAPDGVLFASTRYSGVLVKYPSTEWQHYTLPIQHQLDGFNCVLPAGKQGIWLCSEFGLWYVDRQHQAVQHFLTEQGLPSVNITGAFYHPNGELWVLTNNGPARFDPTLKRFISYSHIDGLPDLTLQRNAVAVSLQGDIVLGTAKGAVQVMVDSKKEQLLIPKVVLTHTQLNYQDYFPKLIQGRYQIELPYNFRELLISFAVLDYREPDMNRARSRLLGVTDHWQEMDKQRELRFVSLKPGSYTLEIDGQNSRGLISAEPLQIELIVAAPWWFNQVVWFAAAVLFFALVMLTVSWREAHLRNHNAKLADLVQARTAELERLTIILQQKADHDHLTGLLNRRGFTEVFVQTQAQAARHQLPLSLVLLDLDHFKLVNDRYGHDAGDYALQFVARLLQERLRKTDFLARWGGEEFVILLPNTNLNVARKLCESLLQQLISEPCQYQNHLLSMSATFGVCSLPVTDAILEHWIKEADQALYQGKTAGRARVVVSTTDAIYNS